MPPKDNAPPPGRRRRHLHAVPSEPDAPDTAQATPATGAAGPKGRPTPRAVVPPRADPAVLRQWVLSQLLDGSPSHGVGTLPAFRAPRHRRPRPSRTLRVRVDIAGARPPIWRRLDIDSDLTLHQLHAALQAAFGWLDGHLHQFVAGGTGSRREYFVDQRSGEVDVDMDGADESSVRIGQLLATPGESILYEYDFGDDWEHRIVLEESLPRAAETAPVVCVAGRRRGPLEDSGGMDGYQRICQILAEPSHPEYAETCAWVGVDAGDEFDPAEFSVDELNEYLIEFGIPEAT